MSVYPNFALAKSKAREVLEGNFIVKPPVVAHQLAESYGLSVKYCVFNPQYADVAGFIDVEKNVIAVNGDEPRQRQNFTIAHELGHFLLGHLETSEYTCLYRNPEKQVKTPIEQEANCFAANLLVPAPMLQEYVDDYPFATDLQLSKIFGVSPDVIRVRKLYLRKYV